MKKFFVGVVLGVFAVGAIAFAQQKVDQGAPGKQGAWPVTISSGGASIGAVTIAAHGACTETTMNVGTTGTACPASALAGRTSVIIELVQPGETLTVTEDNGATTATATAGTAISSGGTLNDNLSGAVAMSCRCTAATCSVRVRECP